MLLATLLLFGEVIGVLTLLELVLVTLLAYGCDEWKPEYCCFDTGAERLKWLG